MKLEIHIENKHMEETVSRFIILYVLVLFLWNLEKSLLKSSENQNYIGNLRHGSLHMNVIDSPVKYKGILSITDRFWIKR